MQLVQEQVVGEAPGTAGYEAWQHANTTSTPLVPQCDSTLVMSEFGGGAGLLFQGMKKHQVTLPGQEEPWNIQNLLTWVKKNLLKEKPELFIPGDSLQPGILVLMNNTNWEPLDGLLRPSPPPAKGCLHSAHSASRGKEEENAAGQSEAYANSPCHSPVYPSLRWVSTSAEGWGVELGAGMWGLESNPGKGTAVDHEETGVRSSTTRSARGGSLDLCRSKVPLLRDVQSAGLSSCSGPCLLGHMGGLPLELTRGPPPSLPPPCPYSL
ncbi:unnamed protein product [Rangifer tarandus platyrhynchus]|uniref:Uncharacterized protein n=2 Tax=Rangifer tarandus platyrhynchus TaxID=3082113 RepID=A0ACB0EMR1_RANTA|nr:unnamed protein product [Rangifer tarandus platyrhynchus]CAI9701945.1 unnamed protein product [Rangifer tarandus platyrhynchus]